MSDARERSRDAFLGGRLRLDQPVRGHRSGHDAVLLAAACPARGGETLADLGAGVGAAGLCVAARVPLGGLVLAERDPCLAALAEENARANGFAALARIALADVTAAPRERAGSGLAAESVDHVVMNPPFFAEGRVRASPDPSRRAAHAAPDEALERWIGAAVALVRQKGSITLIHRPQALGRILAALSARAGAVRVLPVLPAPGRAAVRVVVGARRGRRGPLALLAPLVLAGADGRPSPEAEALTREAGGLDLDARAR